MTTSRTQQIQQLEQEWKSPRWEGILRPYSAEEVIKLRGSVNPECTLAQHGAKRLWELLHGKSRKDYINWVQRLIRIHAGCGVSISRDLPEIGRASCRERV